MPIPKDILERMKASLDEAQGHLDNITDVLHDMRLAGIDTKVMDARFDELSDEIRKRRVLYERQKAKAT